MYINLTIIYDFNKYLYKLRLKLFILPRKSSPQYRHTQKSLLDKPEGISFYVLFLFKHPIDAVDYQTVCNDIKYLKERHHFRDAVKAMNMDICCY